MGALIAIGVLCDNRAIFDEGVTYYKSGAGTGNMKTGASGGWAAMSLARVRGCA